MVGRRYQYKEVLLLAYQSLGVVFGDLSISPLYVYKIAFYGNLSKYQTEDVTFGAFSLIFWTFTLLSLFKHAIILLNVDDNGEGGIFALYLLLCRHAKFSLFHNYQVADEEISTYYGPKYSNRNLHRSSVQSKRSKNNLLLLVLFGTSLIICFGFLTPAISIRSSIDGLIDRSSHLHYGVVINIACVLLVGLFILEHCGTYMVAFMFSPIVILWSLSIGALGLYNIIKWNPRVFQALSPYYIYKFFRDSGRDGWISLSGILLCITGTETMFTDLGQYTVASIRLSFCCMIYPCLVLQYMGQAAFLSKNFGAVSNSFYASIPDSLFWPVLVMAILAAIIASQSVISATFATVKQCHSIGCFPRVKMVQKSNCKHGQVYTSEINWLLLILCLAVMIGFRDINHLGNAYGFVCMAATFVTTCLTALVISFVWRKGVVLAVLFGLFFGSIEIIFLTSSFIKIPSIIILPLSFLFIMHVWHYGNTRKYLYDLQKKVSLKWILSRGPCLKIVRVPGIGLIFTELVTGVPTTFTHFLTNLPAFYQVVVFVCEKIVPVQYVPDNERFMVGRVGPKSFRIYRCIIRNGCKDVPKSEDEFENSIIMHIAEFIQLEAEGFGIPEGSADNKLAVVGTSEEFGKSLEILEHQTFGEGSSSTPHVTANSCGSMTLQHLRARIEHDSPRHRVRRRVRFKLLDKEYKDQNVREELLGLLHAKHAGVAYVVGHSLLKTTKNAPFFRKLMIQTVYSFLRKNSRSPATVLNIPHTCLIEVGMNYYL